MVGHEGLMNTAVVDESRAANYCNLFKGSPECYACSAALKQVTQKVLCNMALPERQSKGFKVRNLDASVYEMLGACL